jgi:hypothetical protein
MVAYGMIALKTTGKLIDEPTNTLSLIRTGCFGQKDVRLVDVEDESEDCRHL